jgi:hypothetical protein
LSIGIKNLFCIQKEIYRKNLYFIAVFPLKNKRVGKNLVFSKNKKIITKENFSLQNAEKTSFFIY